MQFNLCYVMLYFAVEGIAEDIYVFHCYGRYWIRVSCCIVEMGVDKYVDIRRIVCGLEYSTRDKITSIPNECV